MIEHLIVALIVILAVLYTLWRWMPARWRGALVEPIAAQLHRAGFINAARAARWRLALRTQRGCGACADSAGCGACASSPAHQNADAKSASASDSPSDSTTTTSSSSTYRTIRIHMR
ncbi:MAG: hypothetical protein LBV61_07930 [Burkholderiaceae bacterium]|jgi:hypothetical protein|nr:hypothetical protein [Burkholderiaceae bacterium]